MSRTRIHRALIAVFGMTIFGVSEVGTQEVMPVNMQTSIPILLRCPADRTGDVDLIYRTPNRNGTGRSRLVVSYVEGVAYSISLQSSEAMAGKFKELNNTVISAQSEPKWMDYIRRMTTITDPILNKICFGTKEAKTAFYNQLERNRAQ